MLDPANTERVQIPVLLMQAGRDTMVLNDKQDELVELLSHARKVEFPDAKHEIFRGTDAQVQRFMETIFHFIE